MFRITRWLMVVSVLLLPSGAAFAEGTVSLNWDSCTGPVTRTVAAGDIPSLYVSVLGQTELHKIYDVRVVLANKDNTLFDAWRFDAGGCQGSSRLAIDHIIVDSKSCPTFMQTSAPSLQIKDYSYDAITGRARCLLANSYPNGVASVDPGTRYLLARFQFDQSMGAAGPSVPGVSCGGLDQPLCVFISGAHWAPVDPGPTGEVELEWPLSQNFVTANAPGGFATCQGTPARASTWGLIKSQYRN